MSGLLSGTRAWLLQRLSALFMVLYLPLFALLLVWRRPGHFAAWRAMIEQPIIGLSLALFFLALLLHTWIGMRDVILDYFSGHVGLRLALLTIVALWLAGLGLWLLRVLLPVVLA